MTVIIINAVIIFLQGSNITHTILIAVDIICTFVFILEMCFKHYHYGFKQYWRTGLNAMDGVLVILSIPSFFAIFYPEFITDLSFLIALRTFRVFRFFRLVHVFPSFTTIANNFMLAMKQSNAVFIGLLLIIFIFALISCSLFGEATPQYFGTPLDGIYTTFRLFTIEGWYDIPDEIASQMGSPFWGHFARIYFCVQLFIGGIIGMSLLNSIFVDAMVSDNNDDVKEQLKNMEDKIDRIEKQLTPTENLDALKAEISRLKAELEEAKRTNEIT